MNIVRALEVALPELPERIVRQNPPKLNANVVFKEHIEKGKPIVIAKMPGSEFIFRFSPLQWKLIQMFDGKRTHAKIAEDFSAETDTPASEDDVKELASYLQVESELLYKTPLEENVLLQQQLRSSRRKRSRFGIKDFSDITLKTWNNADHYITWLYPRIRFLFTPWFVWTSIAMFVLMGYMWAARFGEVWSDSFAFYNFTRKSGSDLFEFWFLFGTMAAIHETAHGLVGKHFGATVEKLGFSLMYFAPSFFCDVTQVWVVGGKWARIATSIAGIWLDLVVCFFATVIWWGTATGMAVHDWAYKVMLITGIGVSVLNLNPLIKLDGYLIFSELVAEPSLKESSTAYLSGWFRKNICGFPVEVPYVPRRKRAFFATYAVLSGMYSYTLLSVLMLLTYNILRSFTPEWAFVPAVLIGFWVFRSRIKLMGNFLKLLYLDKKERVQDWFTSRRLLITCVIILPILFLPVWPDFVHGPFVVAAVNRVPLRANIPGTLTSVSVSEGQRVQAGAPLLHIENLDLEGRAADARAQLKAGTAKAFEANTRYTDFAAAEQQRQRWAENDRLISRELAALDIVSPISGTIVTPHVGDLVGRSLDSGDLLLEVADTSDMQARIYLPEFAMHDLRTNARVRLLVGGEMRPLSGKLDWVSPGSVQVPEGLVPKEQLQGINPPSYYLGVVYLKNNGELREGMAGIAKVLVARRSIAGMGFRFLRDVVDRKVW